MRRDTFLKTLAALAAAGALPLAARAQAANLKMMIPANPGGGWDSTGRALGKALQEAGAASVNFENKGGAAGALGLAQFANSAKGDGNALMTMGADSTLPSRMMANSFPVFCCVMRTKRCPPSPSNWMLTTGWLSCGSKLCCAPVSLSPEMPVTRTLSSSLCWLC